MVPLLVLAAAAIVAGALVWRQTMGRPIMPRLPRPGRPEPRRGTGAADAGGTQGAARGAEAGEEGAADGFVFAPTPLQEERPRRAFALVRLALIISVVAGAIAAGLYYAGYFVKLQLDRIFGS